MSSEKHIENGGLVFRLEVKVRERERDFNTGESLISEGKSVDGRKGKMSKQKSRRLFAALMAIWMVSLVLLPINTFADTKTFEQQFLEEASSQQTEWKVKEESELTTDSMLAITSNSIHNILVFPDVKGHWASQYIEKATSLGLFQGFEDGTFKPNAPMTRVQAVSLVVRLLCIETEQPAPFTDIVNFSEETQVEIATAYKYGIIQGNTELKPNEPITRAQLALMLKRLYSFHYGKEYVPTVKAPFLDYGQYNEETQNAITMLYEFKIVSGNNGNFMPGEPATRAHVAKIFVNLIENNFLPDY